MNGGIVCPSCGQAWEPGHVCTATIVQFYRCPACGGHHAPLEPHDFDRDEWMDSGAEFISEPWKEKAPRIGDPPLTDEHLIRLPRVPRRG